MTRAFIVLERNGSTWTLVKKHRRQRSRTQEAHVPFVYVTSEDFKHTDFSDDDPEAWRTLAARKACEYDSDEGTFLVMALDDGTVVERTKPRTPPVEVKLRKVERHEADPPPPEDER